MKKRILSILLSLAMVLTMIPFATMTAFAEGKPSVYDIIKTGGLPTATSKDDGGKFIVPKDAWENEDGNGAKAFIGDNGNGGYYLCFRLDNKDDTRYSPGGFDTTKKYVELQQGTKYYTFHYDEYDYNTYYTFNMNEDSTALKSITVSGFTGNTAVLNGTYTAPKTKEINIQIKTSVDVTKDITREAIGFDSGDTETTIGVFFFDNNNIRKFFCNLAGSVPNWNKNTSNTGQKWEPIETDEEMPTAKELSELRMVAFIDCKGNFIEDNLKVKVNNKEIEPLLTYEDFFYGNGEGYYFESDSNSLTIVIPIESESGSKWSKLLVGAGIAAGITAATVGTIHTVKAIKNYKAEKAAEEAARKAAEELEAAKALVEATALTQNKLTVNKNGSIKVSYNASDLDGVVGYEIERATDKAFTKSVKTYNTAKTTLTNSKNLKKGTKYFYRVRAKVELADGSIAYTDWSNTRYIKATKTR